MFAIIHGIIRLSTTIGLHNTTTLTSQYGNLNRADWRFSPVSFDGQPLDPKTLPCATHFSILRARLKVSAPVVVRGFIRSSSAPMKCAAFRCVLKGWSLCNHRSLPSKIAFPNSLDHWTRYLTHMEASFVNPSVDNQIPNHMSHSQVPCGPTWGSKYAAMRKRLELGARSPLPALEGVRGAC